MVAQSAISSQHNCVTFANLAMLSVQIKEHANAVSQIVILVTLIMGQFVIPVKAVTMELIMIIVK